MIGKIGVSVIIQNKNGDILLVQERKPGGYGKYNLPGGHLKESEALSDCGIREVEEELNITIKLEYLLGIYHGPKGFNVVYYTSDFQGVPEAQSTEILACKWFSFVEIQALPKEEILNSHKFRMIINDLLDEHKYPLKIIKEINLQDG